MRPEPTDNKLFGAQEKANIESASPLAVRMRPRTLAEFIGQKHFLGPDKLLTRMIRADRLTSLIFYGPPGTGKTSLARIIADCTQAEFHHLHAPAAGVADIRAVSDRAGDRLATARERTVLFIDEIHRFSRAQQDVLLDDVETGVLIFIGATTENPFFSVNAPLISRSTVFRFEPLASQEIAPLLKATLADDERGLGRLSVQAEDKALQFLATVCDGDARRALNALEIGVRSQAGKPKGGKIIFNLDVARQSIQEKTLVYDGTGDTHYDLASALQKSMRGSDPDATVYWLARMLSGGEDIRFIARRIAVCAAEDVGNADPMATVLAAAAVQVAEFIGMPEAQLPLAQAAIYVACAPKSNATASAIWQAMGDVKREPIRPVPKHLKDSHYAGAKKMGLGLGYKYPHEYEGGFVVQEYLSGPPKRYYKPKAAGLEKDIARYLQKLQALIEEHRRDTGQPTRKED